MKYQKTLIENAFLDINSVDKKELLSTIDNVFQHLESGKLQIIELLENKSIAINEWIKKAILLKFKTSENFIIASGFENNYTWFDKIDLKFNNWTQKDFQNAKIRSVPGAFVRSGCYIGQGCVIMPSFINVGASIGEKTMIDSGVTVGSCCSIGNSCHISSNVVIAGVLEPLQDLPVVIGNNCFIGAGSVISEGIVIEDDVVIGMGTFISKSTKIIDRRTKEIYYGRVPSGSVVVSGMQNDENGFGMRVAIIVKKIDSQTRQKTSINDLLRD